MQIKIQCLLLTKEIREHNFIFAFKWPYYIFPELDLPTSTVNNCRLTTWQKVDHI